MIQPLEDLPPGVIGFRAVGVVEPGDYETTLDPAVERLLTMQDKINLVYVIGDDFDRYSVGALWQDTKLGMRPPKQWGRIALVTDHDWLHHAVSIFSPITPGDVQTFPLGELEFATAWAAGEN